MKSLWLLALLVLVIVSFVGAQSVSEAALVDTVIPPSNPQCAGAITTSCPLAPYENELALQDQVFCPNGNTATGLELQGYGCQSLEDQYCCSAFNRFSRDQASFHLVGVSYRIDELTGAIIVPAKFSVRIEFRHPACVAKVGLSADGAPTSGSVRISRYYVTGVEPAVSQTDAPLSPSGSVSTASIDECRLIAISFTAPADAALYINSMSMCMFQAHLDSCGVCGGDGSNCLADLGYASFDDNILAANVTPPDDHGNCTVEIAGGGYPIVPSIYCHRRVGDQCCTVWGYQNQNAHSVSITPGCEDNYIIPPLPVSPYFNRGQPQVFIVGGEAAAFSVYWNCTLHVQIHLKWQVDTLTSRKAIVGYGDTVGQWPNGLQVHRHNKQHCPSVSYCPIPETS